MCLYQVSAAPTSVGRLFSQELCTENYLASARIKTWAALEHNCMNDSGHGSNAKAQHCRTGEVGFAKMVRELYQGLV